MKKILFKLFIILFISTMIALPAEAQSNSFGLTAQIGPDNDLNYTINLWQPDVSEENKYNISLPFETKGEMLMVEMPEGKIAIFDGVKIKNGSLITAPTEGIHTLISDGVEYQITVFYGADIPSIYITTKTGTLDYVLADKSNNESGVIAIIDGEDIQYVGELDYIKGRGNMTWKYDKKPFNIKLAEKTDLFGMGKSKGWSLLANYVDVTSLRSKVAIDLADAAGIEYSSKSVIVDLFVNGDYMGNYTLIEKVEIDDNRVEITNLEDLNEEANPEINIEECEQGGVFGKGCENEKGSIKYVNIPNNPKDVTGGYLLEYELKNRYGQEVSGFVSNYGQCIVVKSPEYASKEQVEYISQYYQEFENAVRSDDGYNEKGKHYSDYMDMESMAKMYVFQEYVKNMDVGLSSFYLYKETGGKLVAAPVWDFDKAVGYERTVSSVELSDPIGYFATDRKTNDDEIYTIISLLCQHRDFRRLAAQQWKEYFVPEIDSMLANIDTLVSENYNSLIINKIKWTDGSSKPVEDVKQWYNSEVDRMKTFLIIRADFMTDNFDSNKYYVSYHSNGAEGEMLDIIAYDFYDKADIMENSFTNNDREFLGWNTEKNGSGITYMPGDEIEITENITLWAQWEPLSFIEIITKFFSNVLK